MALDYAIRYCSKCGNIVLLRTEIVPVCKYCNLSLNETEYIFIESVERGNLKPEIRKAIFEKYIKDNPEYSEEAVKNREEQEQEQEQERYNRLHSPSSGGYKNTKNVPKCPICQSTNLSKITVAQKAGKIALFGVFGMGDNGKTWKCNNCGSKF